MQAPEIELKLPVSDPEALQSRLSALGFQLVTPRTFEHNTLYDTPARDLLARRQVLRIRRYGELWTVTHKRPEGQDPSDVRYKVRIETETAVADGPTLAAIFEQMGYLPAQAQTLFSALRDLDDRNVTVILCPLPPAKGIGLAIRDRLEKAARAL